jgi:hypothetical protein
MFTLVIDDFGIRYTNKQDVEDLIAIINKEYKCSQDWTDNGYIGLTLKWNYEQHYVDLSMPGYIARALQRFMHPTPPRPEHAPHDWTAPTYGARQQFTTIDTSPAVDSKDGLQRHKTHTGSAWHPVILRSCSQLYHDPCYRLYCHSAGQRHQSQYESHHPTAKLLRHASRCRCINHQLQRIHHPP